LANAATAGITAESGGSIAGVTKNALDASSKVIVGATSVIAGAAANKIVGLPSGFRLLLIQII